MKDYLQLREFIQSHLNSNDLVLCTLVAREGSSYRSLGAKKVVDLNGPGRGLMSGGCLEASIDKFAREHIADLPRIESFSTLSDEDRLLGYQTGCQGVITILFECIGQQDIDLLLPIGSRRRAEGVIVDLSPAHLGKRKFVFDSTWAAAEKSFFEPWRTPIHLVIVGAGLDAIEFVGLSQMMGWSYSFFDHRRSPPLAEILVDQSTLKSGYSSLAQMAREIPQGEHVAVVVMTHNYEVDLELFRELRKMKFGYVGALGPAKRLASIKEDLRNLHGEEISDAFAVFAPAGVLPKGRSPEAIALSIVAQIQDVLVEKKEAKIWTVILAAGESKRFGSPKALASWRESTFLQTSLETARAFSGRRALVVTGAWHAEIAAQLSPGQTSVQNDQWHLGMGASIACGVREVLQQEPDVEGLAILPVDQVMVSAQHLQSLYSLAVQTSCCALTANSEGEIGAPAFVPKAYFAQALGLASERGLKSVLKNGEMAFVRSDAAFVDFDTPEAVQKFIANEATQLQP